MYRLVRWVRWSLRSLLRWTRGRIRPIRRTQVVARLRLDSDEVAAVCGSGGGLASSVTGGRGTEGCVG